MQATLTYSDWAMNQARHAIELAAVVDDDTLSPIMAQEPNDAAEGLAALFGMMSKWSDADLVSRAEFVRRVAANAEVLLADIAADDRGKNGQRSATPDPQSVVRGPETA